MTLSRIARFQSTRQKKTIFIARNIERKFMWRIFLLLVFFPFCCLCQRLSLRVIIYRFYAHFLPASLFLLVHHSRVCVLQVPLLWIFGWFLVEFSINLFSIRFMCSEYGEGTTTTNNNSQTAVNGVNVSFQNVSYPIKWGWWSVRVCVCEYSIQFRGSRIRTNKSNKRSNMGVATCFLLAHFPCHSLPLFPFSQVSI